jgi:hypothetical protein
MSGVEGGIRKVAQLRRAPHRERGTIRIRHGAAATEPFTLETGQLGSTRNETITLTALCFRQPQVNQQNDETYAHNPPADSFHGRFRSCSVILPSKRASIWIEHTAASNLTRGGGAGPASGEGRWTTSGFKDSFSRNRHGAVCLIKHLTAPGPRA